ncbi:uncharacterized protein LOC142494414 [Ascaphus truei]|uniref:uncharacterized protein LOC142494414 n=1 Tax=Ascaphus truei TaxID=8439 RepID=UPI003F5A4B57
MPTSELHLPTIHVTGHEGVKNKTVTLAALVDFFMARDGRASKNRDQFQNTYHSLPRYLPSTSRKMSVSVRELVSKQAEYTAGLRRDQEEICCEEQAILLPLSTLSRNMFRCQDTTQIHHVHDKPKEEDEHSEKSFKSIRSVQSVRSDPESVARKKWTRSFGGTKHQYNKPSVNFPSETKRDGTVDLSVTGICCPKSWADPMGPQHKAPQKKKNEREHFASLRFAQPRLQTNSPVDT